MIDRDVYEHPDQAHLFAIRGPRSPPVEPHVDWDDAQHAVVVEDDWTRRSCRNCGIRACGVVI